MSVNNIKIYDIFRKDLHLEETKAQELLSEMDAAYSKDPLKTDVQQLTIKLTVVDTKLDGVKETLDKVQTDNKQIYSRIANVGIAQYVAITGTILGIIWTYFKFFK